LSKKQNQNPLTARAWTRQSSARDFEGPMVCSRQ
jgi:hypothetical protein